MEIRIKDSINGSYCTVLNYSNGTVDIFEIDEEALKEDYNGNFEEYLKDEGYELDQIEWMKTSDIDIEITHYGFK